MEILQTNEFWYFFIPLIAGFVIYYMGQNTKDERAHLLNLFKANQRISKDIQNKLKQFINDFNASEAIAFPERNLTYGTYLEMMSEEYEKNLSDELYEFTRTKKLTKPTLLTMIDSLNKQNEALRLMEIDINLVIKKANERIV